MKISRYLLLFIICTATNAAVAQNSDVAFWDAFPKPDKWVNDYEGIFTDSQELELTQALTDYHKNTGTTIIVVTINSPKGLDALNVKVATSWQKDKGNTDDALVIGISKILRRMRIQNGFGIQQTISDAATKDIIDTFFIPQFKKDDYYQGTLDGVNRIKELLKE